MFHFISGLPRSGSTLIASILNQNPACFASIMSPVGSIVTAALTAMGPQNEAKAFLTKMHRERIIRGIFDGYYENIDHQIVFDNNRRWTANVGMLAAVFPESKVVCCVRSPNAIVDSFEQLFQKNPLDLSAAYGGVANTTVYGRMGEVMAPGGVVGYALNGLRSAFFGPYKDRLMLVEYDDLARFPAAVVADLTAELGLPVHNYKFDFIDPIPGAEQFDQDVSTPGLHSLKPQVVYENRPSILPPDIWNNLPAPFWRVKEEVTAAG
jgi:sulfotransferase